MGQVKTGRPKFVWMVLAFYSLTGAFSAFIGYLIFTGEVQSDSPTRPYFDSFTVFDFSAITVLGLLNLVAALALCLLRRSALFLFLSALGLNLILMLWYGFTKGWMEPISGSVMTGGAIGSYFDAMFSLYAWKLSQKGVLK